MYTYAHVCIHALTHTCTHTHMHTHTHTHTHTRMCARTHAHTHTHTHYLHRHISELSKTSPSLRDQRSTGCAETREPSQQLADSSSFLLHWCLSSAATWPTLQAFPVCVCVCVCVCLCVQWNPFYSTISLEKCTALLVSWTRLFMHAKNVWLARLMYYK